MSAVRYEVITTDGDAVQSGQKRRYISTRSHGVTSKMTVTVVIKSKAIRRAENVARIGGEEMHARLWWGKHG